MKIFTAYVRPDRTPVLVREGFSWAACIFGVFFFVWHRAWNAAVVDLVAVIVAAMLGAWSGSVVPVLGVFVLQGLLGNDLLRWGLAMHGFSLGPVVAARDEDTAFARLIDERRDLLGDGDGATAMDAKF